MPPGVGVPQFIELNGMVHALLAYTLKFADVETPPLEGMFVDVVMAARVVIVKAIAIMANAVTAIGIFFSIGVRPEQPILCSKS